VPINRELERRGITLRRQGTELVGPCPRCGGDDRFAININKQVFNCRGCGAAGDVIDLVMFLDSCDFVHAGTTLAGEPPPKANGKNPAIEAKKIVAACFDYSDEAGNLLFQVERIEFQNADGTFVLAKDGKRKKTFRQRRPDPECPLAWIWNIKGVAAVPYRLPELIEAIGNGNFVVIVEGEAKVDLLRSWNVPATCNAGGAQKWKPEHAEFLRGADVVILPDNDQRGRDHVNVVGASLQDIAASVRVLELPGLAPKDDIIDWAKQGGTVERLHDLIAREAKPWTPPTDAGEHNESGGGDEAASPEDHDTASAAEPAAPKFVPIAIDDVQLSNKAAWRIRRILPARGLAFIVGPPKCGKSFFTTDMLFSVARGVSYAGRPTLAGTVIYLTGEGIEGFKRRLIALRRHHDVEGQGVPFFHIEKVPDLGSEQTDVDVLIRDLEEFIAASRLERPCAIVLDTLARCMGEGDENSARDMGRFINRCGLIERHFGCVVVVVHHVGKNPNQGGRGSNAQNGAADMTATVEKNHGYSTVRIDEMKDGPEGQEWRFRLVPFELERNNSDPPKHAPKQLPSPSNCYRNRPRRNTPKQNRASRSAASTATS
jgi:hypothetical protein